MDFSKAKMRFEDGFKIIVLLDTSVKINVITRKVMEYVGLAI